MKILIGKKIGIDVNNDLCIAVVLTKVSEKLEMQDIN